MKYLQKTSTRSNSSRFGAYEPYSRLRIPNRKLDEAEESTEEKYILVNYHRQPSIVLRLYTVLHIKLPQLVTLA